MELSLGKAVLEGPIGEIMREYIVCPALQLPFNGPTLSSILDTPYTLK